MRIALALALIAACSKSEGTKPKDPQPHAEMGAKVAAADLPPPGTAPAPVTVTKELDPMWTASIKTLRGKPMSLADLKGKALLLVNVASQCGNTPQYTALEALQKKYEAKGFTVVGFPCNQFGGQEPGDAEQIQSFCTSMYGVKFPLTEKIEVNGADRHPLYERLVRTPDERGRTGDITWNFEKFLVDRGGRIVARFSPPTKPDDPRVISAVEGVLQPA